MKRLLAVMLSGLLATNMAMAEVKKVYINQIVEHPALDMTAKGIVDGLKERGYEEGKNLEIDFLNAAADNLLTKKRMLP